MSIFTYHLVKTSYFTALKILLFPPSSKNISGLIHMECMNTMTLGSAIFSPSRLLVRKIAIFAQWENEIDIDLFLKNHSFGKILRNGWHIRLAFLRQWGTISNFKIPNETFKEESEETPVVAITLARMKFFEIPRFIRWGRPVEKLVRDHPGSNFSLASIKFPRTVSTFSIWKSQNEMTNMVFGHSTIPQPKRHINAMKERNRKDFHFEFTTLRFKPLAEFGEWNGHKNLIPKYK